MLQKVIKVIYTSGNCAENLRTRWGFEMKKLTWGRDFTEFCWQWGIGWRLGPASGAPVVQPLGGDEASRNVVGGRGGVSPASPPESLLAAFSPRARAARADASPGDQSQETPTWRPNGELKSRIWLDLFHAASITIRARRSTGIKMKYLIPNPFSSIVWMSELQSSYISTSVTSVIHENFTLLKIVFLHRIEIDFVEFYLLCSSPILTFVFSEKILLR